MPIKYSEAKKILSKYAGIGGKCPSADGVDLFVKQVLQYLLLHGTYGNERKFCFVAQAGCITLPKELETPLKVRIDGEVGSVWNRWFEYHDGNNVDNACLAYEALLDEPNRYPTVYNVPSGGRFIAVLGHCEEACDAHVVIKGKDSTGREIFTMHKGEKIVGEYLTIAKGKMNRTSVSFAEITEVSKTTTNGYATLYAVDGTGLCRNFLADYDPYETSPSYRRMRFLHSCPDLCSVSILGRIRLKEYYADDDLIPFDNLYLLSVAGQTVNSMYNSDIAVAQARDTYVKGLIETEGNYKKINNGQPVEMFRPLSGGAVMNAGRAGRKSWRRFW